MNQNPDRFEQRLNLLQHHCGEQEQFAVKDQTRLYAFAQICERQLNRLLLEVS